MEKRNTHLSYEYEKEKAKCLGEKDYGDRRGWEFADKINELEREKDRLIKENESYKSELKKQRLLAADSVSRSRISGKLSNGGDRSFLYDGDRTNNANKRYDRDRSFLGNDNLSETDSQAERMLKDLRDAN